MPEGQEPNGQGQGQEPNPQQQGQQNQSGEQNQQQPGQEPGGQQGGITSLEDALAELQRTRQEAARYRTERQTLQQRVQEFEQAQMTETERLQTQMATLQAERDEALKNLRETTLRGVVAERASTLKFRAPALAHRLIDLEGIPDGDGALEAIDAALKDLAKAHPDLVVSGEPGGADGGTGGAPNGGKRDMNALIRQRGRA